MTKKRYAIVRVQEKCPYYEVISKSCLLDFGECEEGCNKFDGKFQNGDTKEQLIRKVAQALKGTLWNDRKGMSYEEIAIRIVEFLGVE